MIFSLCCYFFYVLQTLEQYLLIFLFLHYKTQVTVKLENGQSYEGDLLVGADGIWSKVVLHFHL